MKVADFDIFDNNSSTNDALADFICDNTSMNELIENCWPKEVKTFIRKHKKNEKNFKKVALQYLNGIFENFDPCAL